MFEYTISEFLCRYNFIKNRLLSNVIPEINPKAFVLGGQPGAGKSLLQKFILEKDNNFIVINADAFRRSHPHFLEIQAEYADEAPKYTQPFINQVTERLINELSNENYNLIIEGTLRTTEVPLNTCKMLKSKGYTVELHVISVKKEISFESTILRYELAFLAGKVPRATSKSHHDLVADAISENLDKLYKLNAFDDIKLFSRAGKCIYTTTMNTSPYGIENEMLNGNWTDNEIHMLKTIISEVKKLKFTRNAPDYGEYVKRTDLLLKSITGSFYFLKVTSEEAELLKKQGIHFQGKTAEYGKSIIKINAADRAKAESLLCNMRNKNINPKL